MTKAIPPKNIVLYADDDADDLQLVEEALTQYANNVEVVTVTDGIEALSYLKNLSPLDPKPCLIILDINMPRMDGKEVLTKLRSTDHLQNIPVVLFSTSSMRQDKEFAAKYNAGFLTKPIDIRQMEMIADHFIDHCVEEVRKNMRRTIK